MQQYLNKSEVFQNSPKGYQSFGLLLCNFLCPWRFKNCPIWSHCYCLRLNQESKRTPRPCFKKVNILRLMFNTSSSSSSCTSFQASIFIFFRISSWLFNLFPLSLSLSLTLYFSFSLSLFLSLSLSLPLSLFLFLFHISLFISKFSIFPQSVFPYLSNSPFLPIPVFFVSRFFTFSFQI